MRKDCACKFEEDDSPDGEMEDMAGPAAALEVDFSVSKMLEVLLKVTKKDNGTFLNYSGGVMPW